MSTHITLRLRTFLTTIAIIIVLSAVAQTEYIENSYGVPNKTWSIYYDKTQALLKQVDPESFFNYVIFSNDGKMTDLPYFKKYIHSQIQKNDAELIYRIGKGIISTKQQLSVYLSSLQPSYTSHFIDFKKNYDEIIRLQIAETQNQNTRRLNSNPTPQNCGSPCTNPGFESGTGAWDYWTGSPCTSATSDPCSLISGLDPTQHVITTGAGFDPIVGAALPVVAPGGSTNSMMLGDGPNAWGGNPPGAARASLSFTVSSSNANFTYQYAVVLHDPGNGHTHLERPYFNVKLLDQSGDTIPCGQYHVWAETPYNGFTLAPNTSDVYYRPWTTIFVPLQAYIGQCVTIQFTSSDCTPGGHYGYAYIDGSCDPLKIITSSPSVCGGNNVLLSAPAGGASYVWTDSAGGTAGFVGPTTGQTAVINQGGTYKVVITSVAGGSCTTTLYTTIGSNPSNPVAHFTNTTVCPGVATQFTDASTPVGSITHWVWDFNHDGIPDDTSHQNPTHIFPAVGTYPVTLTITWGACAASDTQNVVITNVVPPVLTPAGPFCANASPTTLTASVTGGTWSGPGITNAATGVFTPSTSIIGYDTVTYSITATCPTSASEAILVNALPVADAGPDLAICTGNSGSIGAASVNGCTYSWSPSTGLSSTTVSNPTVTLTNPGTAPLSTLYTVTTVETAGNCQSTDVVQVTVNANPTANAGSTQTVCKGASITLAGAVGGTATGGTWSGGTGTYNPNNTTLNAIYTPSAAEYAAGSVQLTLTTDDPAGPCTFSSSNVTFNFYETPVVNFSVDVASGCPIHCVNFTDSSTIAGGGNIASWAWSFGDGSTGSTIQNPSHCFAQSGYYDIKLTITSNNGCVSSLTKPQLVHVFDLPIAEFDPSPNPASVLDPTITFQNQSSPDVSYWHWNFGDSVTLAPSTSSPVHTYPQDISSHYLITLIVHNPDGCYDTVSHPIFIGPEFAFFIPNAFTPNGDGTNDYFFGHGIGIIQYDLWIFDRWGDMIFHGRDLNDKWNGKANSGTETAQIDVYVWKVTLTDVFNIVHDYIGTVTLVK